MTLAGVVTKVAGHRANEGTPTMSGAMNAQLQGFHNVEHPEFGPDWSIRFQLQFLFPK